MNKTLFICLIAALSFSTSASAIEQRATVFGKWKTIDDNTGEPRSIVELYKKDEKLFGKIVKLFQKPGEDADPICDQCEGDNKNKNKVGLVIINGLTKSDDIWGDGEILDPDSGDYYTCELWLEDGKLSVRGYMFLFFRTQTWLPVTETDKQKKGSPTAQHTRI